MPFELLLELFTLVAVVLLTIVLPVFDTVVPRLLLPFAGTETVEELLLTELLTPVPPLREVPVPDVSLCEPVW